MTAANMNDLGKAGNRIDSDGVKLYCSVMGTNVANRAGAAYTYMTAANMNDLGKAGNRIDSDGVKLYCSVMGTNVANRAMQVLGGYGYVGEYQVERLWRDA